MPHNPLDAHGRTLLARACASNSRDIKKVREAYEANPDHIDLPDYAGTRPVHEASLIGFTEAVEFLIKKGCDINAESLDGDTPLIDAAANCFLDVVMVLLAGGANPTKRNRGGEDAQDAIISREDDDEESKRDAETIKNTLIKAKDKWARNRRASEGERRPRPRPDLVIGTDDDLGTSREQSVSSRHHSPHLSVRSGQTSPPPLKSQQTSRGRRRGEPVGNSALYFDAQKCTMKELLKAIEIEDNQRCWLILDIKADLATVEPLLLSIKGANETVINLLLTAPPSTDLDPDPAEPPGKFKRGQHTPILAAIGRGKPNIVDLLLKSNRFDPARTFDNKIYADIARERQGEGWEEEFEMLERKRAEKLGISPRKRPPVLQSQDGTPSPRPAKSTIQLKYSQSSPRKGLEPALSGRRNGSSPTRKVRRTIDSSSESDSDPRRVKKEAITRKDLTPSRRSHPLASPSSKRPKSATHPSQPETKKLRLTVSDDHGKKLSSGARSRETKIKLAPSAVLDQPKRPGPISASLARSKGAPGLRRSSPQVKKESQHSDSSTPLTSPRDLTPSRSTSNIPSPTSTPENAGSSGRSSKSAAAAPPASPTVEELMKQVEERGVLLAPERARTLAAEQQAQQVEAQRQAEIGRLEAEIAQVEATYHSQLKQEAEEDVRKEATLRERREKEEAERRRVDSFPHGWRVWYQRTPEEKQDESLVKQWTPIFYADGSLTHDTLSDLPQDDKLVLNIQAAVLLAEPDLSLEGYPRFTARRPVTETERRLGYNRIWHLRLADRARCWTVQDRGKDLDAFMQLRDEDLFWIRLEALLAQLRETQLLGGAVLFDEAKLRQPFRYCVVPQDVADRRENLAKIKEAVEALHQSIMKPEQDVTVQQQLGAVSRLAAKESNGDVKWIEVLGPLVDNLQASGSHSEVLVVLQQIVAA